MRIAWLRPRGGRTGSTPGREGASRTGSAPARDRDDDPLDDIAALLATLGSSHDIELVNEREAHDFVWRHARTPYDLVVHELADSPAHRFVLPYAIHFPGVLLLRGAAPQYSRAIMSSPWTVVGDLAAASALREQHPDANVRCLPIGVDVPDQSAARGARVPGGPPEGGPYVSRPEDGPYANSPEGGPYVNTPQRGPYVNSPEGGPYVDTPEAGPHVRFAVLNGDARPSVERAAARARQSGARIELITAGPASVRLGQADVVLALEWPPPLHAPPAAVAGMAAGLPVVVFETLVTAGWAALDPQTWQPRGFLRDAAPIAISIDPRDEEHSLMLAMRRLAADVQLRQALGATAHAWWQSHATAAHAAAAWTSWLADVSREPAPMSRTSRVSAEDGSEHARSVLEAFGVHVDFLTGGPIPGGKIPEPRLLRL
jgi:hypothetical protein